MFVWVLAGWFISRPLAGASKFTMLNHRNSLWEKSRGGEIRTHDLLDPNQALNLLNLDYQKINRCVQKMMVLKSWDAQLFLLDRFPTLSTHPVLAQRSSSGG